MPSGFRLQIIVTSLKCIRVIMPTNRYFNASPYNVYNLGKKQNPSI